MEKSLQQIIHSLWIDLNQEVYSLEEVKRLVQHAYEDGRLNGYNDGYKDAEDVSSYSQGEY